MSIPSMNSGNFLEDFKNACMSPQRTRMYQLRYVTDPPAPFGERMNDWLVPTQESYHTLRDEIACDPDLNDEQRYALQGELFQRWGAMVDGVERDDDAYLLSKEM